MKRFNLGSLLVFLAVMIVFLGVGYLAGAATGSDGEPTSRVQRMLRSMSADAPASGTQMIDRALQRIEDQYFMEIDPATRQKMIYAAVQGLISPLRKDPYADDFTNFYDPEFYKNLMAETTGHYAGIGILMGLTADGQYPEVNTVFKGTPAEEKGMLEGDVITEVDGKDTFGMILPEVAQKIKGEPGTDIKLKVYRPSDGDIKDLDIQRRDVSYSSVSATDMLDNKVGYIKITSFAEETGKDFRAGMEKLSGAGMKSLVIDLRDNPGGLLEAARDVADCFVKDGPIVKVDIRGNQSQNETLSADPKTKKYTLPTVILINANSASASEVLTSAMRDYGLAKIVGEKSFGKGVVQAVTPMETDDKTGEPKDAMAIVIGKYFTPKHVEIHKHGIDPDVWYNIQNELRDDPQMKQFDDELRAKQDEMAKIRTQATTYMRKNDLIKGEAVKVAAALGRGESVPNRPEVKPPSDHKSPLGPPPSPKEKKEPKQSDQQPVVPPTGKP